MDNTCVCHFWIWSFPASVWSIKITTAAVLICWCTWWRIPRGIRVAPIVESKQSTWWVAPGILVVVVWVEGSKRHTASALDVLSGTHWSGQSWAIEIGWVSSVSITIEVHLEWKGPSIDLACIVPIKSLFCAKSGFKFWVNSRRAASVWAWKVWTTALSKCTVFSLAIALVLGPEASCADWLWDLIVHNLSSINPEGLRPQIILGLVIDPDRLACPVDDTELRVLKVLSSVGVVVIDNICLLSWSSDSEWKIKVAVNSFFASLIAASC